MRTLTDHTHALTEGLLAIRKQYRLAQAFPPAVLAAADVAVRKPPSAHADWTDRPFVTLDPATSTDLDQAFHVEQAGSDLILHYAIADVGWFVEDGDALDAEAWQRGTTQYLPDGKVGLYPPVLSEGAASLLPDGPRPAVLFTTRVNPQGEVALDGVQRVIIHSRAKLAYDAVQPDDLPPGMAEIAARIGRAEAARGASRVDPPEQEVLRDAQGHYRLQFSPSLLSERQNAALSLATNLAVAKLLLSHRTGLFRVMDAPEPRSVARLRFSAAALGLDWPAAMELTAFERSLDAANPKHAAFMLALRRAGDGARYAPYRPGEAPWHNAMAASYVHATAPLRRLADRYVVRAALALGQGQAVPPAVIDAFARLPKVMATADATGGQLYRAAVDLAEAALLADQVGQQFAAVVTDLDEKGARIQLCDLPITARVDGATAQPGDAIAVQLVAVDQATRRLKFAAAA